MVLKVYIFTQVTWYYRYFEASKTAKINNVAFQVIPSCDNSFTEKVFTNIQARMT